MCYNEANTKHLFMQEVFIMMSFEGFAVFFTVSVVIVFLCLSQEEKLIDFEDRIILRIKHSLKKKNKQLSESCGNALHKKYNGTDIAA